MKIEKLKDSDISEVVDLWYDASVKAHSFISADYWKKNKETMAAEHLSDSETYSAVSDNGIIGFISMKGDYLAAVFVKNDMQGGGVGTQLLDYVKQRRNTIRVKVYKKNTAAVRFYERRGFKAVSEQTEEETGEPELLMEWNK